jgi:putative transposase
MTFQKVDDWIDLCRNLYNVSLEQRINCYKYKGKGLSYIDQCKEIPELRESFPEYREINVQLLRDVLERLKRSYDGFFQRIKRGETAGFPRFKGEDRYKSFTLHQNGWKLEGKYLTIKKLGKFKIRLSRPIDGDINIVTIKKSIDKLYVIFSCDKVPENKLKFTSKKIGLDMGIVSFCVDSKGKKTENPLYFKQSGKSLRQRQRALSRKKKGSQNRKDAKLLVIKIHEKITNQRDFFLHQIANYYIKNYGNIFIEDLSIDKMVQKSYMAKNIHDSSWGKFFQILSYKAEEAGRSVTKVNPQFTSQRCSKCGAINHNLKLHQRIWTCPVCGTVHDRDVNGAKNILWVGQTHQTLTWDRSPSVV